jgi:glyoxylase-like metal-dependent hydrolase (beta-lactamase superfamily II)
MRVEEEDMSVHAKVEQANAIASEITIHLLSDGISYWDGGGAFGLVPRIKWMKLLPPDEFNRVPQDLRSVLIRAAGKNILVDCGVGAKPNDVIATQYEVRRPQGHLLDDLARHGLRPDDIDIVIFTHLHGDHSGWATECIEGDVGCVYVPTFANARYYVQRQEYVDATRPNERTRNTYFGENFVPLMENGVLELLDGPADIVPGVRAVPTPGHTAGHQSVIVERRCEGAEGPASRCEMVSSSPPLLFSTAPLLILGDLATYMIQFSRLPWVTAYDVLPMQTIETKRHWQQWALQSQAMLISPHDTQIPLGRLAQDGKGYLRVDSLPVGLTQQVDINKP